jgi:hypothetical protein
LKRPGFFLISSMSSTRRKTLTKLECIQNINHLSLEIK